MKVEKSLVTKADLKEVEIAAEQANKVLNITNDDHVERAAEVLINLKTQVDVLELKRKEWVGPANETVKRINADFKTLTEPRNSYITQLKEKIVGYVSGRFTEVKEKEGELQKELKSRSLVLDPGFSKIVTSLGEVRFRQSTDIKVTNRNLVPEQYWILDTKKMEADLDAGVTIPGVKIKVTPIASCAVYADK